MACLSLDVTFKLGTGCLKRFDTGRLEKGGGQTPLIGATNAGRASTELRRWTLMRKSHEEGRLVEART